MLSEIAKHILPFSTPSQNRRESFTKGIERAAIFCLAEMERGKGGGVVLKHPKEKLDFIAEVCYPFWLVTLDKVSLLFDGLCTTSQTLIHKAIPDIQTFIDNTQRSSQKRKAYVTFLSDNINYFQTSDDEEEKTIDGLITDPNFLLDFNQYLMKATLIKNALSNKITVSPTLNESSIISLMKELQNLRSKLQKETNLLYQSMKIVRAKTDQSLEAIREEIKMVREEFSGEIEKSMASVSEKVEEIQKRYDGQVEHTRAKVEDALVSLQQDRIKLEKIKKRIDGEIEQCDAEIKTHAVNKDDVSERKWKEERDQLKEQLAETETKLKEINKKIKEVRDNEKLEIFRLKSECNARTGDAKKNLVEIESSRDAKIEIHKEEMEDLEELTSSIIDQIDKLARLREKNIDQFNNLGIKQKQEEHVLVYMPFYLISYKSESGRRYAHFPPSIAKNVSLSVRLRGALGRTRIKQLLQPRSETIASLLNKFPTKIEQDPVFNREINEACTKADLLKERVSIKTGLEKLREEGWLSETECESFIRALA